MDLTTERIWLLRRDAEWSTAASEGRDVERILSYWTDDAIVLPPGLPAVVGKAALRRYVEGSMQIPGFRISWTSTDVIFSPDGNLAYMHSRNAVTMDAPDGTPTTTEGRAVTIWLTNRREFLWGSGTHFRLGGFAAWRGQQIEAACRNRHALKNNTSRR